MTPRAAPGRPRRDAQCLAAWREGMTAQALASAAGVAVQTARNAAKRLGLTLARQPRNPRDAATRDRNAAIAAEVAEGTCSLAELGQRYEGLSRERIRQIARGYGVNAGRTGRRAQADKASRVGLCPHCGKKFNHYVRGHKTVYCSRACWLAGGTHRTPAEILWDGWCAWLRLGNVFSAGEFAGTSGPGLAGYIRAWGMRCKPNVGPRGRKAIRKGRRAGESKSRPCTN